MADKLEIWEEISNTMKKEMSELNFNTWIAPLEAFKLSQSEFVLLAPNQFTKRTITNRYLDDIQKYLNFIVKNKIRVVVIDKNEKESYVSDEVVDYSVEGQRSLLDDSEKKSVEFVDNISYIQNLNPKYTFDTFVKGKSNELALAAAKAVAEAPAVAYNPLFIYGGPGLGKTHLMQAIAHEILRNNPKAKVIYVSSETFTNELISSIGDKSTRKNSEFRDKYRKVDVLLIDDIQFIAGKQGTQEEFFHTFNDLYGQNKQIIISSDRPPKEIKTLENRLISRFEWGLMADIQMPDYETRVAILRSRLESENADLDSKILEYIAMNVKSNIRELEGALMTVLAYKKLMPNEEMSLEVAKEALKTVIDKSEKKPINIDLIMQSVADHYNLEISELRSKNRAKNIAYPRQIAMYISRQLLDISLVNIAAAFNKDHSTVVHGIKKVEADIKNDEKLKADIDSIIDKITNA